MQSDPTTPVRAARDGSPSADRSTTADDVLRATNSIATPNGDLTLILVSGPDGARLDWPGGLQSLDDLDEPWLSQALVSSIADQPSYGMAVT